MRNLVSPKKKIDYFLDLNLIELKQMGFKLLLIDLDNTMAPYYEKHIDRKSLDFINQAKELGFEVVIFSNNKPERVEGFLRGHDINSVSYALKPFKISYKKLLKKLNYQTKEVVAIGDQLLTDVIGANRMHIYSIYCKPIIDKDSITTVISRRIERLLFKYVVKE